MRKYSVININATSIYRIFLYDMARCINIIPVVNGDGMKTFCHAPVDAGTRQAYCADCAHESGTRHGNRDRNWQRYRR